ncbi:NAD(P)H pyrophosphatase NUDT13, mitochondrial-like [Hetaerina americana]|uniref:NAD(P)H pyrophosphatase NUDT13, mitochondrial-like n=1 Tax=Hetaerina americana TaxID=62018 RepID=UPI003A7F225C
MFCKVDRVILLHKTSQFCNSSSPQIEYCFPNAIRRVSSYVERIRRGQNLKENVKLPVKCYENGNFILFSQKPRKVLVQKGIQMNKIKQFRLTREKYQVVSTMGVNVKENSVFLGLGSDSEPQFALEIPYDESLMDKFGNASARFLGVRKSLFLLSEAESSLTSQACSLLSWHKQKVHCPDCGNLLINIGCTGSKLCTSESCSSHKLNKRHYPPINPVGISIVSDELNTKVLLVRQPSHLPGMFTCIAGFLEVGESVEDNIRREVAEEVGLDVIKTEYVASQHWAFPASRLMLGYHATVKSADEKISLDAAELEDAAWFTPKQLRESLERVTALADKELSMLPGSEETSSFRWVPPKGALANKLICWWLDRFDS